MLEKVYSNALLEAAGSIPKARRLDDPDASARRVSKVCGSEVTVDVKLADGVVSDFAVVAKACALGQASASLLAKTIIGATPGELRTLQREMRAMLKEDGPVPSGSRFAELAKLEPIREYPARHASTLLVFDAVVDCLDQIEAGDRLGQPALTLRDGVYPSRRRETGGPDARAAQPAGAVRPGPRRLAPRDPAT